MCRQNPTSTCTVHVHMYTSTHSTVQHDPAAETDPLVHVASLSPPPDHWVRGALPVDRWLAVDGEHSMVVDVGQLLGNQRRLHCQFVIIPWQGRHLAGGGEGDWEEREKGVFLLMNQCHYRAHAHVALPPTVLPLPPSLHPSLPPSLIPSLQPSLCLSIYLPSLPPSLPPSLTFTPFLFFSPVM